jgi:phage terminase large subunit-like protein
LAQAPNPWSVAAEILAPGGKVRDWALAARPEQRTPGTPGAAISRKDWLIWLLLAGRGFGKTRTGAEDARQYGQANRGVRVALVAPTYADARDVCVEGESGLLAAFDQSTGGHYRNVVEAWNRSLGELVLHNETRFKLFSADEPERLRGPQHHRAWCDELAAWVHLQEAWDQLQFGLRLGVMPQIVATTTPKPLALIRDLLKRDALRPADQDPQLQRDVVITRGTTFDNQANLAASDLAMLRERYGSTRLGRQELYGDVMDQAEGALWSRHMLDECRVLDAPRLGRVVVALDPDVSSGVANATGLVAAGLGLDGRAYVLHSDRLRMSPDLWARRAVMLYRDLGADRIIAEKNQGGELVRHTLMTVDPNVPLQLVSASRGKRTRAEPVAALYEQGRVSHVGYHATLEDEQVNYTGAPNEASPDVMDAAVWALWALLLDGVRARVRWFTS